MKKRKRRKGWKRTSLILSPGHRLAATILRAYRPSPSASREVVADRCSKAAARLCWSSGLPPFIEDGSCQLHHPPDIYELLQSDEDRC